MRHLDARQRLVQKPAHARLMKKNLLTSLVLYEQIRTTLNRAKAVQPMLDRMMSLIRGKQPQAAVRVMQQYLLDDNARKKVMEVLLKRYEKRTSGLSSIKALGVRQGDGAKLVSLTLMEAVLPGDEPAAKPVKKSKPAAKPSVSATK